MSIFQETLKYMTLRVMEETLIRGEGDISPSVTYVVGASKLSIKDF